MTSAGEDLEKLGPSYIAVGNAECCSHCEKEFLKMLNMDLPYDPATPLLGIYPGEVKTCSYKNCSVHNCSEKQYHNTQKVETTHMSIISWMDKQQCGISIQWNIIWPRKEWSTDSGYNMDKPWKQYTKRKEGNILFDSIHMKCQKRQFHRHRR